MPTRCLGRASSTFANTKNKFFRNFISCKRHSSFVLSRMTLGLACMHCMHNIQTSHLDVLKSGLSNLVYFWNQGDCGTCRVYAAFTLRPYICCAISNSDTFFLDHIVFGVRSTPVQTTPNWTTPNWTTPLWTEIIQTNGLIGLPPFGLMGQLDYPHLD